MEDKILWILENDFSQNWHICLDCIEIAIRGKNKNNNDRCEYLDRYMTETAGAEIADYGYICLCPKDSKDDNIILGCQTAEDLNLAYSRICDAIINHPHCIDLRGLDIIFG